MDKLNDNNPTELEFSAAENAESQKEPLQSSSDSAAETSEIVNSADAHTPDFSAIAASAAFPEFEDVIEFDETDEDPDTIIESADSDFTDELVSAVLSAEASQNSAVSEEASLTEQPSGRQKKDRKKKEKKKEKKHSLKKSLLNGFLMFFAVLGAFYLAIVYSSNSYITKFRNTYIQTAMATLTHKYLATALFPSSTIDSIMRLQYETDANAIGVQSNWGTIVVNTLPSFTNTDSAEEASSEEETSTIEQAADSSVENDTGTVSEGDSGSGRTYSCEDEEIFFQLFYELDYDSVQDYVSDNPDVLDDGWAHIDINEAGLDDSGTSIETIYGDQVLAINAAEGIVLIRIEINSSRGVMAICKDTAKLSLCPAETLGTIGQTAGRICDANDGILAINGSAFYDDGTGNGGQISGLAVCSGVTYGSPLGGSDKRLELRNDNRMYIVDSISDLNADTRDACEFRPALIVDGEIEVDDNCGWTGPNPRATIGQTSNLETVMCILEGRLSDSPGDSVVNLAYLMQEYGCVQALNLDGGTSAIMYYDGEYVTRCSNEDLPSGRTLSTAWVYR